MNAPIHAPFTLADAIERVQAHDANKPTALGDVTQWAAKRGLLANEALAYDSIKNERRAAVADAVQSFLTRTNPRRR